MKYVILYTTTALILAAWTVATAVWLYGCSIIVTP
jgi:hypothetical protein